MAKSARLTNLIRLLRSGDPGHLFRYYGDRIRVKPAIAARSAWLDLLYARRLLGGDAPSRFSHLGARAVHHTQYAILDLVFGELDPDENDTLVDVGCGKGRVLIYWLYRGFGRRLVGLELDPEIAERTALQFKRFPKVEIVAGDAIANIPEDGTLFYLYNPFVEEKVIEFERRVHALPLDQRVRVVYYNPNFPDAFPPSRWNAHRIELNGRLDRGTLQQFCFAVLILERKAIRSGHSATS